MFLGNEEMVYILDKAEGNAAQIGGHPAWGSVWLALATWISLTSLSHFIHIGTSIPVKQLSWT